MSRIPFSSIQNHDNTEQARIYPAKLKDIVPGRQSGIIAGLNKCKILTGTNASNGSRTRGYIFPFCSPPLVGMYLCSLSSDHPGRPGRHVHQHSPSPASCASLKWMRARYQYQIRVCGGRSPPHIRLDSRFAFNAFYMCGETERDEKSARTCSDQTTLASSYQIF